MKKITILLTALFYIMQVNAQFSIRQSSTMNNGVDILYTPPASGVGVHAVQYLQIALQMTNPQGTTVTAAFFPLAAVGQPLYASPTYTQYTGIDGGSTTFAFASNAPANYANTYNFPTTETVLGTVVFSPSANAAGAMINAIDYQNETRYGGQSDNGIWTMSLDATGVEVTNFPSIFYQSALKGTTAGSDPPIVGSIQELHLKALTTLPVIFSSFTATNVNCSALLKWSTESEINSSSYVVESSKDGNTFNSAGQVASKNAANGASYTFSGPLSSSNNYFRIKAVDIDGNFKYTSVVVVNSNCNVKSTISVWPNPVINTTTVSGLSGKNTISVIDDSGRQLSSYITTNSTLKINMGGLVAGSYTIKVTATDGTVTSLKILK